MNDRFKFRIFYSNKMVYPNSYENIESIYECLKQQIMWDSAINVDLKFNHIANNLVFMQCTGLKDKNGKLIYEGDIVKITKEDWRKDLYSLIYLVCWDRTQWQLGLLKWQRPKAQRNRRSDRQFPFKDIVSFDDYTPNKFFAQCEVIGNYYENKELLESEQLEEESKSCVWMECIDEGRSTIGYTPCCKGTYKGANQ